MKLRNSNKGAINVPAIVEGIVLVIVAIIVIFNLVGQSASDVTTAADNISGSGLPLASLFQSSGVVLLIYMAGILLAVLGIVFLMVRQARGSK